MARLSVQDFVTQLDALADAAGRGARGRGPDHAAIAEIVGDPDLDVDALQRFVGARDDKYARRLVHRSEYFDVMVLTWKPGQATPVHNHAGNCGWVRLVRGRIVEDRFALAPSSRATGIDVAAELPAADGKTPGCIELVPTGTLVVTEAGAVADVDRKRAIHRISNPLEHVRDEIAVTLHVYCKPHDVCLVFDPETRTCGRREMVFDAPL